MTCKKICVWNESSEGCEKPQGAICPVYNVGSQQKPQTNADRIRAMSDEELAEFLELTHPSMVIRLGGKFIERAKEDIKNWLKQPAEDEKDAD